MSMNVLDAASQLVRSLPGGVEATAVRLGKSAHTLRHELAARGTAKLSLLDADSVGAMAREVNAPGMALIVNAMAATINAVVVLLPESEGVDGDTFTALAQTAKEFSDFVASVAEAAADGRVTKNELDRVNKELGELVSRVQALQQRLAAMHEAGIPASERGDR